MVIKLLSIARLEKKKRPKDAVRVAELVKGSLTWIGDGPLDLLKTPHADFVGFVSEKEKKILLNQCDVFISTSEKEGFNISIGEAILAGKPCVAYELDVYKKVWGDAIFYVPPFDVNIFARTVEYVYTHPEKAAEKIRYGQQIIEQRYSAKAIALLFEKHVKNLLHS